MRFHKDVDRPRGWNGLISSKWFCHMCEKHIPGDSDDLIYIADLDYVYHIHSDKLYRVLKVKQRKIGIQISLPGVDFE